MTKVFNPFTNKFDYFDEETVISVVVLDKETPLEVGDGILTLPPLDQKLNKAKLIRVNVTFDTAGTTGNTTVMIRNVTKAVDMLSSVVTIASGNRSGNGTVDASNNEVDTGDEVAIDVDAIAATPPEGFKVTLVFARQK